jgi:hypothetical protein
MERELPPALKRATICRNYNRLVGSSLSHLDLMELSLAEYDEILLVTDCADLLSQNSSQLS